MACGCYRDRIRNLNGHGIVAGTGPVEVGGTLCEKRGVMYPKVASIKKLRAVELGREPEPEPQAELDEEPEEESEDKPQPEREPDPEPPDDPN